MKKILLLTGLLVLLATSAKADNDSSYFTMGVNDTLFIKPSHLGLENYYPVNAHFESRFDSWILWVDFPNGLNCTEADRLSGMDVPYITINGTSSVFPAELTYNASNNDTVFASSITELGYWDSNNDGIYESYGTAKWEAGDYAPMFSMKLNINAAFRQGYIDIMGHLTAGSDLRGGTGDEWFYKSVFVKVGYRLGDINGDGYIDATDVSILNYFIMGRYYPDEFQFDAGDINGDGELDVEDVAILIRWVLGIQSMDGIDLDDFISF